MTSSVSSASSAMSYGKAGVDIEAGETAVRLMKEHIARARRSEVLDDPSGFAGLFDASALAGMTRPLLTTSTDGVGTKVDIARRLGVYDTIGLDLVAMVVDDLAVSGAEPLFMTDYIACGKVVPDRIAEIVKGIAEGCRRAGCALIGGETAEHPGLLEPDEFDLAGAATGVVEADRLLGAHRVRPGDAVLGLASSGVHSNGFSLVRLALADIPLDRELPELDRSLGAELLTPTRIYARDCLELAAATEVHAYAHITGGGLAANLARSLPDTCDAVLDRDAWPPPAIFEVIAGHGGVDQAEMDRTFNLGVGMAAIVPADSVDQALSTLRQREVSAWVIGEVVPGSGTAGLRGSSRDPRGPSRPS